MDSVDGLATRGHFIQNFLEHSCVQLAIDRCIRKKGQRQRLTGELQLENALPASPVQN